MPDLNEELAQEYGPGVAVQEVDPGAADDPFKAPPGTTPPPPSDQGAGGEPAGERPQEGAEQTPPAPADQEDEEDDVPPSSPASTLPSDDDEEEESDLENRLAEELREFAAEQVRAVQSAKDAEIGRIREERDQMRTDLESLRKEVREQRLTGLPEEERSRLLKAYEDEDRKRELDQYADLLSQQADDLEIRELLTAYGQYGVTEEDLRAVDFEERGAFCLAAENQWLRDQIDGGGKGQEKPAQNGARGRARTAKQTPEQAPEEETVPAGSRAPSDVSGGGTPAPVDERDKGQGADAMVNNISRGWERVDFSRTRSG